MVSIGLLIVVIALVPAIVALRRTFDLEKRLRDMEWRLLRVKVEEPKPKEEAAPTVLPERPVVRVPTPPLTGVEKPVVSKEEKPPQAAPPIPPVPERAPVAAPSLWLEKPSSFEFVLGTRWLAWVGMVLTLVGTGLFLKYMYDNAWIGPKGRLAIGTLAGVGALCVGERFRRRNWSVLFQTLTGGGIAAFYICIYFSFQIYHLSGQALSMGLAVVVTLLAIVMGVVHNAVSIAILALVGGFLSPVLLSEPGGVSRPYQLFTYIAILDLVAMGAAYFRRWRALDLLCFAGTALVYQGWFMKYYSASGQPSHMVPALLFISVFYLMFLFIPVLYSLVRRLPETVEGVALVVANAAFSFSCYYGVLFKEHRLAMGFVVLGQAVLVLLLLSLWTRRTGKWDRMAESLLIIALALVTIAVPIQLRLYAIPITWALEGILFAYLGVRFRRAIVAYAGVAALFLAAAGLLARLPLHKYPFVPVFNVPFGSWVVVLAALSGAGYLLSRDREDMVHSATMGIVLLLGFVLGCALFSMEVGYFWTLHKPKHYMIHDLSSQVLLWSLIPACAAMVLQRRKLHAWTPLALVCYAVGLVVFLVGLGSYDLPSRWFAVNYVFPARLAFVLSLWCGGKQLRQAEPKETGDVLTIGGHVLFTILLAMEMYRWGEHAAFISQRMAVSLISAIWAVQAFVLIWLGLVTRNLPQRILGFVLFGVTIAKVCFYDLSMLERVYQIVSFIASGLLALAAGYFYQRYSPRLLGEDETESEP